MINLLKQTLKERDHHFELEERVIPWLDVDNDWSDLHPATASHLGRENSPQVPLLLRGCGTGRENPHFSAGKDLLRGGGDLHEFRVAG